MDDVLIITADRKLARYFEETVSEIREKISCKEIDAAEDKAVKLAANYMIVELRKHMAEKGEGIEDLKITPENYAELVGYVACGKINSSAAQTVLHEMYRTGGDPSQIISEKNLAQVSDVSELENIISEVMAKNEKSVEDFRKGKENAMKFLIGQVMAATKGKANPQVVQELLKNRMK